MAEERNEQREPTQIQQFLMDMVFHEDLAFPVHKNFRLWLSTVPIPNFPKEFTRQCKLVARELPNAVKFSTQKMLSTLTDSRLDSVVTKKLEFKKLVFSLTVMHAVLNKRGSFGKFGWSHPYQFSPNDWKISLQILEELVNAR